MPSHTTSYFQHYKNQAIGCLTVNSQNEPDFVMASLLADCSKLAYADKKTIASELKAARFEAIKFFDYRSTEGFLAQYSGGGKKFAVLAFRGTAYDFLDIVTDIKIIHSQVEDDGYTDVQFSTDNSNSVRCEKGTKNQKPCAHSGFLGAMHDVWGNALPKDDAYENTSWLGMSGISNALCELPADVETLYVTGHSLGGAIATLAAYHATPYLPAAPGESRVQLYTFGCPRVSNRAFASKINARLNGKIYRFVNHIDVVPRIPFSIPLLVNYTHRGNLILFDSCGKPIYLPDCKNANFGDRVTRWLTDAFVYCYAPVDFLIGMLTRYTVYKPHTTKAHEIARYCEHIQMHLSTIQSEPPQQLIPVTASAI